MLIFMLRVKTRVEELLVAEPLLIIIIIMYIYHACISDLRAHMIHIIINLNTRFCTHVGPTKTIDIIYYVETHTCVRVRTHTHTHRPAETGY